MSIFYLKKARKQTPRANRLRQSQALKREIKAYLRKYPGVTNAAKVFNISEDKIYKMIRSSR